MEVPVLNIAGKEVGRLKIDEASLGGRVNPALIKQAYVRYHANTRQGSARTKNRSRVEGSTRKLFKQKGTGNARVGPVRTVVRRGGGMAFAKLKTREEYRLDMPVKMRRKANRNALLAKLVDNEVKVLEKFGFSEPSTKQFKQMLDALGVNRTCLVAVNPSEKTAVRSARNIDDVTVTPAHEINAFNMLNHRFLVISKSDLEAWLGGPSSKTDKNAKPGVSGGAKAAKTKEAAR